MISFLTYSSFILGSEAKSNTGNEISPNIHEYNQVDQYKTITSGKFYVFKVTFTTIKETVGKGGAIYVNGAANLLIESSGFILCHSKDQGGAIYFSHSNGINFLKKVWSTNSYSSSSDNHFCYISTKRSSQCTNRMEQSSVANLKSTTKYNLQLHNSDIIVMKYDNITKNACYDCTALVCRPYISGSISYTSFENNTSTSEYYSIMGFWDGNSYDMNTCNVIGNIANIDIAIIYVDGSLDISNSCLIENTKTMFNFDSSSSCTITNCTIDSTKKAGGGSVPVSRKPFKSFINNLDNNGCFSFNASDYTNFSSSKCVCMTFNMIGNRCNMLKRRDNYILMII